MCQYQSDAERLKCAREFTNSERKAHESGGRVHISSILSVLTSALDDLEQKIDSEKEAGK